MESLFSRCVKCNARRTKNVGSLFAFAPNVMRYKVNARKIYLTFVAFSPSVGPLAHKWSNKIYISFGDSTNTVERDKIELYFRRQIISTHSISATTSAARKYFQSLAWHFAVKNIQCHMAKWQVQMRTHDDDDDVLFSKQLCANGPPGNNRPCCEY